MTAGRKDKSPQRSLQRDAVPEDDDHAKPLSRSARKALGAFYTPEHLAEFLAHWAIRDSGASVLEPSVGDGTLIRAALRLVDPTRGGRIVGVEIDKLTFLRTQKAFLSEPVSLLNVDFLRTSAGTFGSIDVLLANPPFTRNHSLSEHDRKALKETHGDVVGAAGMWVYFLLHSLPHLNLGGRVALIAPGAATFADYAAPVLEIVRKQFSSVSLLSLSDHLKWEGGAQERAVLILADGYGKGLPTE